ncbi:hypothetical protein A0H81_02395 [Grifola frondosa]|uniref:Death domain-containing protein n=1 Tax=Grifola frondosa TaxID=5627 RepID=A0A1C7MNG9_GRIFR|nr:hypothetical protein A0H81_02395 [Grifola frondosa]
MLPTATFSWTKGYFAFPPTVTPKLDTRGHTPSASPQLPGHTESHIPEELQAQDEPSEHKSEEQAWEERRCRDAQVRAKRREMEQAEALLGEMDWIRLGGSLRDAYGRIDRVRTEQLRAEVRLQDEERRLMAQWDAYEERWRVSLVSTTPVAFKNLPWPLTAPPTSVDELTHDAIAEFLLAPLRVRKNTITKRERIRASLLRWHPDKTSWMFVRLVPDDFDVVREGIHAVFRCLKTLQDLERQPVNVSDATLS